MKIAEAVDRIGEIDAEVAALLEERQKLVNRLGEREGTVAGTEFKATGFYKQNTWLDPKKVKRRIGAEALGRCYSSNVSHVLRVTPLS